MDKSLLKKAAIQSVALMIAVVTLSYALKHYQTITVAASSLFGEDYVSTKASSMEENNITILGSAQEEQIMPNVTQTPGILDINAPITSVEDLKGRINGNILPKLGDNFLIIKKPAGDNLSLQLEDIYINHSIQLSLTGLSNDVITKDMFLRVRGEKFFTDEPAYTETVTQEADKDTSETEEVVTKDYGDDLCHGITIVTQQDLSGQYSAQVLIELDSVYAYIIYEDAANYYIDLRKPSEIYDKIVVIDPGHGGRDAGAISKNGKVYEKNINLGIAMQLKQLLEKEDIKVYFTRTGDDKVFLRPRSTLANSVDCDYFISIHCNSNTVSSPNGTEVLYYDTEYKGVKSADLAALFAEELAKTVPLKQKGIVKRNFEDIFIMDQARVPMVLIEVGYLSNSKDLDYLLGEDNQMAVAQGIYNSILRAYKELPVTK